MRILKSKPNAALEGVDKPRHFGRMLFVSK